MSFERKLYVIRRLVEKKISRSAIPGRTHFYVPSLSYKTLVYKGMLNAGQLKDFYNYRDRGVYFCYFFCQVTTIYGSHFII